MANNNHFNLTLDTLAPSGTITRPAEYINENKNLVITRSSDDAILMKVWRNKKATGTKSDEEYPSTWETFSATKITNFTGKDDEGAWFYHLQLNDSVNNESEIYNTAVINWDITAPVVTEIYLQDIDSGSKTYTNDLEINYYIAWTDKSPLAGAKFVGKDEAELGESSIAFAQSPSTGTLKFNEGLADGTKTVIFTLTDAAGNKTVKEVSINYTSTAGVPTISLLTTTEPEAVLPEFINYHEIKIHLTSTDTNILNYKIWEGTNEPEEWTAYQTEEEAGSATAKALNVNISHTLSANDGLKTIHAKVENIAYAITSATDATVTIDTIAPEVSLTSNKTIISNVVEFNEATLTLSATDATAGIKSWDLLCGETSIKGELTDLPETFILTSAKSMVEGNNVIKLVVVDNAENENEATVEVILDTTAPTISSTSLDTYQWFTRKPSVDVVTSDLNTIAKLEAWVNTTAEDTTPSEGTRAVENPGATQTIDADKIGGTVINIDAMYMHIKATDIAGNVSYKHVKFGFDDVAPTASVVFDKLAYATTSATLTITYSDNVSGVAKMRITGDITNPTVGEGDAQWEKAATTRAVVLTNVDGMKTVSVLVKDNAGNVQEVAATATCELDTTEPTASISLYDAENTNVKEAVSCIDSFTARIIVTDDAYGKIYYKVYGDFAKISGEAQGTVEPEDWTEWKPDTGRTYLSIADLFCTVGDGVKYVYIKVKDEAGHIIGEDPAISTSFIYDTTAPEIESVTRDYAIISKVHANRISSGETISVLETYADEVKVEFTPNDYIKAYKICAYIDQAAATKDYPTAGTREEKNAWIEKQVSIPQTGDIVTGLTPASVNMHATGLNQNTKISSVIKGADYEYALGGVSATGEYDGAHIVVIYVQDRAGTWSAAADFSK